VLDVNVYKNGEYYNVIITDGNKVFEMIFDVEPGVRNMITTKVKV